LDKRIYESWFYPYSYGKWPQPRGKPFGFWKTFFICLNVNWEIVELFNGDYFDFCDIWNENDWAKWNWEGIN
jgi:hypothetical protein